MQYFFYVFLMGNYIDIFAYIKSLSYIEKYVVSANI